MIHEIDVKTRAIVRGIITTIRICHNCSRAEAEELFRVAISHPSSIDCLIERVDSDVEEQKDEIAKGFKLS